MGTYTLSVMTEIAPDAYLTHAESLTVLLSQTLNSLQNLGNPVAFYVLRIMLNLVPLIGNNQTVSLIQ